MKRKFKKIWILITVFILALAGYFIWSFRRQGDDSLLYTAIEDADLPVACMEMFGRPMNYLCGFAGENREGAGRSDLTVLPEDRRLTVRFEETGSAVKGIRYEIRSLDGEHLVEKTALEEWTEEDGTVRAVLPIQNLLTREEEYMLMLSLSTEKNPEVCFYTRIVWTEHGEIEEMVNLAENFSSRTFDYEEARALTTYLETDPHADNSSLGRVTLKNSFEQLTWRKLEMQPEGTVFLHLKEMQGDMGCVEVGYLASETAEDGTENYYDVTESFTMKAGHERIYMMNYDRRTEQIFSADDRLFTDRRLMLGISDGEGLQTVSDESGRFHAFTAAREVWLYDSQEEECINLFTFRQDHTVRRSFPDHDVRILSVSPDGSTEFLVYGYMNRGNHEGTIGIALYRYEKEGNTLTERLYLPADEDYESLRQDLNTLCYLNGEGVFYLLMNHAVYGVDPEGREFTVAADGLTEENFAVSADGSRIAWQTGEKLYDSRKLNVMDLRTGRTDEISADGEKVIRLIGFVGSDLVYGLAEPGEYLMTDGRITGLPLYAVEIVGVEMEQETRYQQPGIYLMDVTISDSRVHLTRTRKNGLQYEKVDEDTLVCNEEVSEDPLQGIGYLADDDRGRMYFVQMPEGHEAPSHPDSRVPKKALAEDNNVILLQANHETDADIYYAYRGSFLSGFYADFASAVQDSYEGMGIVTDRDGNVLWSRAGRSDRKTVRDLQKEAQLAEGYLQMLADGRTEGEDGTRIFDGRGLTLNQVLYFIYRGKPVAAYTEDGSYCLLYGYDAYNVSCLRNPGTDAAYTEKIGLNDAAAYFEASGGNDFVCFLPPLFH